MALTSQSLYLEDPFTFEFEASVIERIILPGERLAVILDRTFFYPTGGGQEHDTGLIANARVLDVQKSPDQSTVLHIIDRTVPLGPVAARIDTDRRIRHMQHHTAQHLLSQCFQRSLNTSTVSANINGYAPSTIDLDFPQIRKEDLETVENLANQVIFQNLQVKTYFVSQSESRFIPIRKADFLHEDIRVVEIDSFDYSACAGTHCTQTGSIGILKILKTDHQNGKLRVYFIAGKQALENYQLVSEIVGNLAAHFSISAMQLEKTVLKQAAELKSAQKELASFKDQMLTVEAGQLFQNRLDIHNRRCILVSFEDRSIQELRLMALELRQHQQTVVILGNYSRGKISLIVSSSPDSDVMAAEFLNTLLQPVNGRGGGDGSLAQGGVAGGKSQLESIKEQASLLLRSLPPLRDVPRE